MNKNIYFTLLFVFFVLLQVLILNNINLFGYLNPYLYIAFFFLFPVTENNFKALTLGFLMGISIDVFSDTGGINASATLILTYIRPFFYNRIFQKPPEDALLFKLKEESFGKVFNYTTVLTLTHHLLLFVLINFDINHLLKVFTNTLLSSIFTLILFFVGHFIFSSVNQNEA